MSEWISVKQGLPKNGRVCLVVWNGVVQNALYSRDDGTGEWMPMDEDLYPAEADTFSHWMPLPEPPK